MGGEKNGWGDAGWLLRKSRFIVLSPHTKKSNFEDIWLRLKADEMRITDGKPYLLLKKIKSVRASNLELKKNNMKMSAAEIILTVIPRSHYRCIQPIALVLARMIQQKDHKLASRFIGL